MLPINLTPEGEQLLSGLAEIEVESELTQAVQKSYNSLGQNEILAIQKRAAGDAEFEGLAWRRLLGAVQTETGRRMEEAKVRLEELLEAGEINKLDKLIAKMVKADQLDAAFITVLNQNVEDARLKSEAVGDQGGEGASLANVFNHIASRVQEELEKKASPEMGLVHKLMRTKDAGLRGRILGYYLTPQREILLPDTTSIPLDEPKPARVDPMDFSRSITEIVGTLRSMDVDGDTIRSMIDEVKQIAKEARQVIADDELYQETSVLDQYSEALAPTFQGTA